MFIPILYASRSSPAIQRRERKVSQSSNGFSLETNRLFGATQLREQVFCYSQSAPGGSAAAWVIHIQEELLSFLMQARS